MSNISDEKLVKAAIEDDTEAKETLKGRIKSVAQSAIQKDSIQTSDENAEILMADIEQKVLVALPNFVFKVSFETWVYRITVNMILEFQRSIINRQPISRSLNGSALTS